jgi:hypothetical protein
LKSLASVSEFTSDSASEFSSSSSLFRACCEAYEPVAFARSNARTETQYKDFENQSQLLTLNLWKNHVKFQQLFDYQFSNMTLRNKHTPYKIIIEI